MAEEEVDDIIIIEDSEAAEVTHGEDQSESKEDDDNKKKKIILIALLGVLLLVIIIAVIIVVFKSTKKEDVTFDMNFIDEKLTTISPEKPKTSKLDNMIAKANYLYTTGSKEKALSLYKNIAQYSEAISDYNLGVAQLKNKQYKLAFKTFKKAIQNDEKRCVSALNAAVCALHLNDEKSFQYYIDLSYAYLPNEINSPLYSYYYTLINYYKKDYYNALNSIKNSQNTIYPFVYKNLSAKINALYGNDYEAIDIMEKNFQYLDEFSLALLYARIGDLTLAINHLDEALLKNIQPARAQLALGLLNIKAGHLTKAAKDIKYVTDMFPKDIYTYYPVKVKLKDSLFDIRKAQYYYRNTLEDSKGTIYQEIFYFSPYKIFNAKNSINYIQKGNANIYIDNVEAAQSYLKKSSSSSSVNIGITKAIKKALNFKIREANADFLKLVKIQPKHSILQYNLALTYAQLGNLNKAHEHFLRSYYLDAKNYLSGIYAVMTAQLTNKPYKKLKSIIKESVADEESSKNIDLFKALLRITDNDYIAAAQWLEKEYTKRPLYLALNIIISKKLNKYDLARESSKKLTTLLPHDILPHIMYVNTHYNDLKQTQYAKKIITYMKHQQFDYNDLYFGPYITRFLYIQLNLITGKLYYLRAQLSDMLAATNENTLEIESSLALASLYDRHFEEAYTLYNHLIDDLKVRDAYTLFLGAVASTAAEHHENAIALLELSKLKNSSFYESRFALALLYLEAKNNEGASIQLSKIDIDGFQSQWFDFDIDSDELLFNKQQEELKQKAN
jgi:tetratricopeptide (TPR) repeat protein